MERMMSQRETVARALFEWQLAFEREHGQRVVHPEWTVAYADYWGPLASAALNALSTGPAVERVARAIHDTTEKDADRTFPPYEEYADDWNAQAREVLSALLATEEGRS